MQPTGRSGAESRSGRLSVSALWNVGLCGHRLEGLQLMRISLSRPTTDLCVAPPSCCWSRSACHRLERPRKPRPLESQPIADARQRETEMRTSLVLWFTTATPAAYVAGTAAFDAVQPKEDGTIHPDAVPVFVALRRRHFAGRADGDIAVLRSAVTDTKYSATERKAMRQIAARTGCRVLETLNINEEGGDRLLCIATLCHSAA
jgi:hypothetical protein